MISGMQRLFNLNGSHRSLGSSRFTEEDEIEVKLHDEFGDGIVGLQFDSKSTDDFKQGQAIIHSVISGSPAAKAGLEPLDLVTTVNGKAIASCTAALRALAKAEWPIVLRVRRMTSIRETTPAPTEREIYEHLELQIPESMKATTIGITMDTRPCSGGAELRQPIVFAVVPNSPAEQAGLHACDLLLAVNNARVLSTQHALVLLKEASWPIRLAVARPQALHNAAVTLQRNWRISC